MFVYMMLGLMGAPVFAQFKGGPASLLSPTFGFIVSFVLIAYIAGKMIEHRKSISAYVAAALIATVLNYLIGTHWMYIAYLLWFEAPSGFSYTLAWIWMLPPLPKDIILGVIAGLFAHRLYRLGLSVSRNVNEKNSA